MLLGVGPSLVFQPFLELAAVLFHGQEFTQNVGGLVVAVGLQLVATRGSYSGDVGDGFAPHRFGAEGLMLLGGGGHRCCMGLFGSFNSIAQLTKTRLQSVNTQYPSVMPLNKINYPFVPFT